MDCMLEILFHLLRAGSGLASNIFSSIFTTKELKKATNNYEKSRVLGQGEYGIVYRGIHNKGLLILLSWKNRLQIAIETIGALAYLHSSTAMPIIQRDVKTTNILLDDNYTTKVADFGASRLVPLDQTQLNTLVQGPLGYLDLEYMQISQLTEKSDVYSFGVVMANLLTSKKALSFDRLEIDRNLAISFVSAIKEDCLLQIREDHIVNEDNIEQLKEVSNLAKRRLSLRGRIGLL